MNTQTSVTDRKLITCILPQGKATPLLRYLKDEWGVVEANATHARGTGRITPLAFRGVGEQTEKEIVKVVVEAERADALFEEIFLRAEINRPHGGMIFQSDLLRASVYRLPEGLPEE